MFYHTDCGVVLRWKFPTMDAIKKKMQSLKSETENALARAAQLEAEAKDENARAEKTEEHVSIE